MKSKRNSGQGKPYKFMSNEELLRELKDSCGKYAKISKSIPIANEILSDLKLPRCKYKSDMKEKSRHDKLYAIASERKLNIKQEWYDVKISSLDVLRRIETAYYEYVNSMTKKSIMYVEDATRMNDAYQLARKRTHRLKKEELIR